MLAQVVLFDGFDPLDVVAPYEVLQAGSLATEGALRVELVSAEGAREVPSAFGTLSLRASAALDPERADLVVVPGAAGRMTQDPAAPDDGAPSLPAVLTRALSTPLPALIESALDRPGSTVATVCGGSLLLAMAGLLKGRPAVTHHQAMEHLAACGAVAVDARVVDDGDLVSGAGVTSGLDVGLHLLEREFGPRVAHAVEQLLSHERRGIVWRATGLVPAAF